MPSLYPLEVKLQRNQIELAGERDCERCELGPIRNDRFEQVVLAEGEPDATVLIIGEGPGYNEAQSGHPFLGKAGDALDIYLYMAGVNRSKTIIANMIQCAPWRYLQRSGTWNIGKPKKAEINECSYWLDQLILGGSIELVIPVGDFALKKFMPDMNIGKGHGRVFEITFESVRKDLPEGMPTSKDLLLMPQYHPAAVFYDPKKRDILVRDYKRIPYAKDLVTEPPPVDDYELITTQEQWDKLDALMGESTVIAFDFETTGLDYLSDWIVGVAISVDPGKGYYIPTFDEYFDTTEVIEWLSQYLEDPSYETVAHNLSFETHMTWSALGRQIDMPNSQDTMLAFYVLESDFLSLKEICLRVLNIRMTEISEFISKSKSENAKPGKYPTMLEASRAELGKVANYAAADAAITLRLHQVAKERMAEGGMIDD